MNDKHKTKKQKATILIIMAALIAFVALYFIITSIDFSDLFDKNEPSDNDHYIYFYPESLSEDIFEDEKYMQLDRSINLCKDGWSKTIQNIDEASKEGPAFNLIYNMLEYINKGYKDAYNSCFSTEYFKYVEPQGRFTQQKIYNITVTEVAVRDQKDDNGVIYTEYYYTVEYMIRHNNGTLRNDMGSDCIKTQHLILSERYSDEVLIDNLYTLNYVEK